MITKNALLITDVAVDSVGAILSSTAVAVDIDEKNVLGNGRMKLPDGSVIQTEEIQSNAKFGTAERVWEEAANKKKLFVQDIHRFSEESQPFWLLPGDGFDVKIQKAIVELDQANLFKFGSFQLACWSRLVWGTVFFDDSVTPVEHTKLAAKLKPSAGDSLPVTIGNDLRGVLKLESEIFGEKYEASVFLLSKNDLSDEDGLFLNATMNCEGIEASFNYKIGRVLRVTSN